MGITFVLLGVLLADASWAQKPPEPNRALLMPMRPNTALQDKVRALKVRAEKGDIDAMFELGELDRRARPTLAGGIVAVDPEWAKEFSDHPPGYWMDRAADAGHHVAIAVVCREAENKWATPVRRAENAQRCAELREKYPPK